MNNLNNRLITLDTLKSIISRYTCIKKGDIVINNLRRFQKAFFQKGVSVQGTDNCDDDNYCVFDKSYKSLKNNERLEFFGDKVIDFITLEYLYLKYPNKNQGELTELKAKLVEKKSLAKLGRLVGFTDYIFISNYVEKMDGRVKSDRFLEDLFESFMAALYLDQLDSKDSSVATADFILCKKFLIGVYNTHIDFEDLNSAVVDYKSSFLRLSHKKEWGDPVYDIYYSLGNVNSAEFTTVIILSKDKISVSFSKEKCISLDKNSKVLLNIIMNDSTKTPTTLNSLNKKTIFDIKNLLELLQSNVIIGLGKSLNSKKESAQNAAKNAIENLK